MKLPEIKKEVKDFLSEESGIITKESIIKTGIMVGGILAFAKSARATPCNHIKHKNEIDFSKDAQITGSHTHDAWHCNSTT